MSSYPASANSWSAPPAQAWPRSRTLRATPSVGQAISRRNLQIALGVLWLLDGLLQFQPFMYSRRFVTEVLGASSAGQPSPLAHSMSWATNLIGQHLVVANTAFALVQVLIGVGLLVPRLVRPALIASLVWGVGVWWIGEGFGMVLTGNASPLTGAPGAVLLYVAIALLVWPMAAPARQAQSGGGIAGYVEARLGGTGLGWARAVWATLWSVAAVLWLLPANRAPGAIHEAIAGAASGEPSWLAGLLTHAARLTAGHGLAISLALGLASFVIGLGVLTRRATPFLVAGIVLSLAFWVFGQAFGAVLTGQATDPNTGPLFVLLALLLLPRGVAARAPRFSAAASMTAAR